MRKVIGDTIEPGLLTHAIGHGREAAEQIDDFLAGFRRWAAQLVEEPLHGVLIRCVAPAADERDGPQVLEHQRAAAGAPLGRPAADVHRRHAAPAVRQPRERKVPRIFFNRAMPLG